MWRDEKSRWVSLRSTHPTGSPLPPARRPPAAAVVAAAAALRDEIFQIFLAEVVGDFFAWFDPAGNRVQAIIVRLRTPVRGEVRATGLSGLGCRANTSTELT